MLFYNPFIRNLLTIVSSILLVEVTSEFICPPYEVIKPCFCNEDSYSLSCSEEAITQSDISNLFSSVRLANGLAPDKWLNLDLLEISRTSLITLDLTPFGRSNFTTLSITNNPYLEIIIGGTNSNLEALQFKAESMYLDRNSLTDTLVGEFLKFTDINSLKTLSLRYNHIEGSARIGGNGGEFLPNLSSFHQLEILDLYGNLIERIEGGQFKLNNRLSSIQLQENRLSVLGQDAFLFDEWAPDVLEKIFHISFSVNRLTDESIHPLSGLELFGRQLYIYAQLNNFESLSVQRFGAMILGDCRNYIFLGGNPFICDNRMRWLKENPQFEKRVEAINCKNDPGKTIFTTEIVSRQCENEPCKV